jgi:hypothetical protein
VRLEAGCWTYEAAMWLLGVMGTNRCALGMFLVKLLWQFYCYCVHDVTHYAGCNSRPQHACRW